MTIRRLLPAVAAIVVLSGCGAGLRHEVSISPKLRELPVHSICVLEPAFRDKIKRTMPSDYSEMKPENRAESARRIMAIVTAVLSASLTVDTSCATAPGAAEWATEIAMDLSNSRIPLSTKPLPLGVEAVLLIGIRSYGTENLQTQVTPIFAKPIPIGKAKYEHRVSIQALLVKPQTGEVLFDALHEVAEERDDRSAEILDNLTRQDAELLREAFFPKP